MKRKLAWFGATISGLYLLTAGPIPDPIPFFDEAAALALFLKCMGYLGYDLRNWLPFLQKTKQNSAKKKSRKGKEVTIDV